MFPGLKTYLLFKFSIVLALVSFLINNAEAVVFKPFKQQTSFSQITQAPPVLRGCVITGSESCGLALGGLSLWTRAAVKTA